MNRIHQQPADAVPTEDREQLFRLMILHHDGRVEAGPVWVTAAARAFVRRFNYDPLPTDPKAVAVPLQPTELYDVAILEGGEFSRFAPTRAMWKEDAEFWAEDFNKLGERFDARAIVVPHGV